MLSSSKLEIQESPGILVSITFDTTVLTDGSGGEERNINWQSPLLSFDFQKSFLRRNQLDEIIAFFQEVRGAASPFRYRDWSDFNATAQPRSTRYGSITQGVLFPTPDGIRTEFGLVKRYQVQSCLHYRGIVFPDPNTLTIYDTDFNLVESENWIFADGKIIFTMPPTGELLWHGDFDVPVVFSSDLYEYKTVATKSGNAYQIEGLQLQEVRIEPYALLKDEGDAIDSPFALCGHFNSISSLEEQTEVISLTSGFDQRRSRFTQAKRSFTLGKMPLWDEELEYLIAFWRCAKGKGLKWGFYDSKDIEQQDKIPVRFDQDSISLRLTKKGRYEIDGIKLVEIFEPFSLFLVPPFTIPFEPTFIDPQDPNNNFVQQAGDSSYVGTNGASATSTSNNPYSISAFGANASFDKLPPDETGQNVSYFCAGLFWAGGTLHLLVTANSSQSVYRFRLIHYQLNLNDGWNFEYQPESSEQLRNYIVSLTDINSPAIYKRTSGTAQYFRANNSVTFGDIAGYDGISQGTLRFEITNSGNFTINYFTLSTRHPQVPQSVYGDRIGVSDSGGFSELGIIDGDSYYKPGGKISATGYPLPNNFTPEREYEFNIWSNPQLEADQSHVIYHGTDQILKYFPRSASSPRLYIDNGDDGSYLIKVLTRRFCETGVYGCSEDVDLIFFILKATYSAAPVIIDTQQWIVSSTGGDGYYIQTSNSQKSACDRYGNSLVPFGKKLVYYKSGSGMGIDISSQLEFPASNIRNKPAVTPYGFAVLAHSGNIFGKTVKLAFVQSDNA